MNQEKGKLQHEKSNKTTLLRQYHYYRKNQERERPTSHFATKQPCPSSEISLPYQYPFPVQEQVSFPLSHIMDNVLFAFAEKISKHLQHIVKTILNSVI